MGKTLTAEAKAGTGHGPEEHGQAEGSAETATGDIEAPGFLKQVGVYYIWGEIEPGSLKDIHQDVLMKHLLGGKRFNSGICLVINTPGGDVDETNSLIDLLSNVRFPVATAGFGTCASVGAWLLASGTKGLRTIARSANVMIHAYSAAAVGTHHDLVAARKRQDDEYEREVAFWIRHSKYKTRKDVEKHLLKQSDNWMTADEALYHGIVDRIGSALR